MSRGFAYANAAGVGYFLKSPGVTMFTRSSVHCADRIVEIRSWNGLSCFNAQLAAGYASSSPCRMAFTRSGFGPRPNAPLRDAPFLARAEGFVAPLDFDSFLRRVSFFAALFLEVAIERRTIA